MTRRTRLLIWSAIGVSLLLGGALVVAELSVTRIDPGREFAATSRQMRALDERLARAGPFRDDAGLARLKASLRTLLFEPGPIAYPVPLSLADRIARLAPHARTPKRCRDAALAEAVALSRAVSDAKRRPCSDGDAAAVGACLTGRLRALRRAYEAACPPA